MKYTQLLFDADNTLFDYDAAETHALRTTFAQFELPFEPSYTQIYRQINEKIWQDFEAGKISQKVLRPRRFALLFEAVGVQCDPHEFSVNYLRNLADGTELIDGAAEVVAALAGRYQMLIVTNGLKEVQTRRLAQSVLRPYFPAMIISEEVGASKPDPAFFDAVFAQLGNPPKNQVLLIGDGLSSDIQGGNNYHIDVCWFNRYGHPLDPALNVQYEIAQLSELLTILD